MGHVPSRLFWPKFPPRGTPSRSDGPNGPRQGAPRCAEPRFGQRNVPRAKKANTVHGLDEWSSLLRSGSSTFSGSWEAAIRGVGRIPANYGSHTLPVVSYKGGRCGRTACGAGGAIPIAVRTDVSNQRSEIFNVTIIDRHQSVREFVEFDRVKSHLADITPPAARLACARHGSTGGLGRTERSGPSGVDSHMKCTSSDERGLCVEERSGRIVLGMPLNVTFASNTHWSEFTSTRILPND
jgi:hypothetical protein